MRKKIKVVDEVAYDMAVQLQKNFSSTKDE